MKTQFLNDFPPQPDIDYDFDDGWNNERYYAGSGGGPRYKVPK